MQQQRQSVAREIPIPLPVRGIMSEARRSETGGMAETVHNFLSNGYGLDVRPSWNRQNSSYCTQRIPFEFGPDGYIEVRPYELQFGSTRWARTSSDRVSWTTLSNNVLIADGQGDITRFDGTAFYATGFITDTGGDDDRFDGIHAHHDRVYVWDRSANLVFFYGDVGAITGTLNKFDLSALGSITGKVRFINSMTYSNAAQGMQDLLVIGTSTGWLIFYSGLNPGDPSDWNLIGKVKVAAMFSEQAVENFGSDIWILTQRGLVSARETLNRGTAALISGPGKVISDLLRENLSSNRGRPGWQIFPMSDGDRILINVPTGADTVKQYIYQLDSQAWQTTDYPARFWHEFDGNTEFTGIDGKLHTLGDGDDTDGPITMRWATSWFRPGGWMTLAYLIPTIIADSAITLKLTVLTDNDETPADIAQGTQVVTIQPDNPGDAVAMNEQIGVGADGRSFKLEFEITGTNVSFESLVAGVG